MINNLEELYKEASNKELIDLFIKCSDKNRNEIIDIFKENGYEISDDCALECLKCYEGITPIDDSNLSNATGGNGENGCLPGTIIIELEMAIRGLEKYKSGTTTEFVAELAQSIIDDLKDLMSKPYDKVPFKKELSNIEIRVAFLPLVKNNGKDTALRSIAEVQRITYLES